MWQVITQYFYFVPGLAASAIFIQSLFFKFTNSPETQYIFETKLNTWALSLGLPGLFAPGALFSAYSIGALELVASLLILGGLFITGWSWALGLGALIGFGVISGAIFFHLVTPLGIAVQGADGASDGGVLFALAIVVWVSTLYLLIRHLRGF